MSTGNAPGGTGVETEHRRPGLNEQKLSALPPEGAELAGALSLCGHYPRGFYGARRYASACSPSMLL